MNLLLSGLVYMYYLWSEHPDMLSSVADSPYLTFFKDSRFFIGVYVAFLYFGWLFSKEKVLYLMAVACTAVVVYLYLDCVQKQPEHDDITQRVRRVRDIFRNLRFHTIPSDTPFAAPAEEQSAAQAEEQAAAQSAAQGDVEEVAEELRESLQLRIQEQLLDQFNRERDARQAAERAAERAAEQAAGQAAGQAAEV